MKKEKRLYNVLFPIWFLIFVPTSWLIVLPANFLIDSLVLLVALKLLGHDLKTGYKRAVLKVWLFGFLADLIGGLLLLAGTFLQENSWWYHNIAAPISSNPFGSPLALLFILVVVAISAACIYVLDLKVAFRKLDLDKQQKHRAALAFALITAPYAFFLPSTLLYAS